MFVEGTVGSGPGRGGRWAGEVVGKHAHCCGNNPIVEIREIGITMGLQNNNKLCTMFPSELKNLAACFKTYVIIQLQLRRLTIGFNRSSLLTFCSFNSR